jgi:H(+)-translocating pyrophosphatase
MLVRTAEGLPTRSSNPDFDNPLTVMIRAYKATILLAVFGFIFLCKTMLSVSPRNSSWLWFAACGIMGMGVAYLFVVITQYYTDYEYPKVREIADASVTGPATNIITGLSVGMESTALPVLVIVVALLASYYMGIEGGRGLLTASPEHAAVSGLFGTAVATMGMLSTACFVLAMSNFGPIADNAGGIAEMSHQAEEVRAITDRLDAVGNVTKANTKGYAVGSAALACFLLFSAFLDEVSMYTGEEFNKVDLAKPEVFVGGLLGAMLVFLFAALAMKAVGKTAQQVVTEVRRQFREKPGIMEFKEKPDYQTCVAIVSKAALKEMVVPGLLASLSPIVVGVVFRIIGGFRGSPLLGAESIAAFLMLSTVTGVLVALFLNNAGGAWDNAKKYVETGKLGGKGSDAHKAAVVGDTVGDPCKDTAGPSVHVLIKLVSTVTMVMLPLFCVKG